LLTVDALRVAKVANALHSVNDGEELSPPAASPRPGLVPLDLNMRKKDAREALFVELPTRAREY